MHAISAVLFGLLLVLLAVGPASAEEFVVGIWPAFEDSTLLGIALTPAYQAALAIGGMLGAAEIGFFSLNQSLAMKYAHKLPACCRLHLRFLVPAKLQSRSRQDEGGITDSMKHPQATGRPRASERFSGRRV